MAENRTFLLCVDTKYVRYVGKGCLGARLLSNPFAKQIPHAGEDARRWMRSTVIPGGTRLCGRRGNRRCCGDGLHRRGIHVAVKYNRGADANLAHQEDRFRAGVRRGRRRTRVKTEWRHEDGIHGLLDRSHRSAGIGFFLLGLQRVAESAALSRRRRTRVFDAGSRKIAGAR